MLNPNFFLSLSLPKSESVVFLSCLMCARRCRSVILCKIMLFPTDMIVSCSPHLSHRDDQHSRTHLLGREQCLFSVATKGSHDEYSEVLDRKGQRKICLERCRIKKGWQRQIDFSLQQ